MYEPKDPNSNRAKVIRAGRKIAEARKRKALARSIPLQTLDDKTGEPMGKTETSS